MGEGEWRPTIGGLTFKYLDSCEATRLELPFLKKKVFIVLFDLGKDKALDPDGYTKAFWLFSFLAWSL